MSSQHNEQEGVGYVQWFQRGHGDRQRLTDPSLSRPAEQEREGELLLKCATEGCYEQMNSTFQSDE